MYIIELFYKLIEDYKSGKFQKKQKPDTEIPEKHKNSISTILSTHIYTENNVNR